MPRRTKAATAAGQPPSADPTEFVGRNDRGAVRPADDRYLSDAELDERDRYLLEVTGPDAQQLVVKRQDLYSRLDRLEPARLAKVSGKRVDQEPERLAVISDLAESATEMPNAEYRALLEQIDQVLEDQEQAEADSAEKGEQP